MKVVALCRAYNEELFVRRNLEHVYDFVDQIVIAEGSVTPFGNLPQQSTDGTWKEILDFMREKNPSVDTWAFNHHGEVRGKTETVCMVDEEEIELNHGVRAEGKIAAMPTWQGRMSNREIGEGNTNNLLLSYADLEDGDLIYNLDCDEFIPHDVLEHVIESFRKDDSMECIKMNEKQFAYGFKSFFNSSHPRFFRFRPGRFFTTCSNFVKKVGKGKEAKNVKLSSKPDKIVDGMLHFCWSKHPMLVREKVLSFNRPSFTRWFNEVYLVWPLDPQKAYENNGKIPPYHGSGFAEGMHEPLGEFEGELPECLADIAGTDWTGWLRENSESLKIGPRYSDGELLKLGQGEGFWTP